MKRSCQNGETPQPAEQDCTNADKGKINQLAQGSSSLMHACQQGNTRDVVRELRKEVIYLYESLFKNIHAIWTQLAELSVKQSNRFQKRIIFDAHPQIKPKQVKQRDRSFKSVLHYCSGQSDLSAAASVIVCDPELMESVDEDGFTPLHLAVIQGNMAMVNLLLANKTDVNALDNEKHSVVHWATVCGEAEALRAILKAGANVAVSDLNGGSPLHYAAQMCGANYENRIAQTSTKLALEILEILLTHPKTSVNVRDNDGRHPLLWAASAGSAKAIIALVKAGARVESADKDGLTALHCAASRGHTECIDTLISLCGSPTDLIDSNGCTALHYAVTLGHADATARLLKLEAEPNRQDRKGRTPAHCGCAKGQFETVKMLRDQGANLWLRNVKGDLPVHEAAASGRRELVEWLLEQNRKQLKTTCNDGRTLLHIAASNDHIDTCKMLLDYGSDINGIFRNEKGVVMTSLDCALHKGFRSTAKFLQSHGGLPASKLKISAVQSNLISDEKYVKPLKTKKYLDKEQIKDFQMARKYVLYIRKSDSESAGDCDCGKLFQGQNKVCSNPPGKFRRRTSSCGAADVLDNSESSDDDTNRSKSNMEMYRKRCRNLTYFTDDDSCENCCHHRRKPKQRRRRNKTFYRSEDEFSRAESNTNIQVIKLPEVQGTKKLKDMKLGFANSNSNEADNPMSSTLASVVRKRPQSARKRPEKGNTLNKTDKETPEKEKTATFIADTEEEPVSETILAKVDVHNDADGADSSEEKNVELQECALQSKVSEEIETVLPVAVATIANESSVSVEEKTLQVENLEVIKESTPTENISTESHNAEISEKHLQESEQVRSEPETVMNEENMNKTPSDQTKNDCDSIEQKTVKEKATSKKREDSLINAEESISTTVERCDENDKPFSLVAVDVVPIQSSEIIDKPPRKSSFTVLKSDESLDIEQHETSIKKEPRLSFQIVDSKPMSNQSKSEYTSEEDVKKTAYHSKETPFFPARETNSSYLYASDAGKKRRLKKRIKTADRYNHRWVSDSHVAQKGSKDQDSGFEPSPRAMKTKIPSPRSIHTALLPRRPIYATLDGRSCSSRFDNRKLGDKNACNMTAVTRSIRGNIRRFNMERKLFQHLLELKTLQIRSSKLNEAILVKRAVDDYHKSCTDIGADTGVTLRRYPYSEYTFKNFEMFLYETLKSLQKSSTYNFQNINELYEEAGRRLSPEYGANEKALYCTNNTHRCLHAAHAYTGIPCAAYIPMMNHHTMPKYGFGQYKKLGSGSFYLPSVLTNHTGSSKKVALEISHGKNKQLISIPSEKLDRNKRYYVTFTVKSAQGADNNQQDAGISNTSNERAADKVDYENK